MAKMSWADAVIRCDAVGLSRAELARRCELSESTVTKGVRRQSSLRGATRKQVELILEMEERLQRESAA